MDFMECIRPSCTCDQRPTFAHGMSCEFQSRDGARCGTLSHSSASCGKKALNTNVALKMPRNNDFMDGAFDCRMCERVFKTEEELGKHIQNHAEHRPYKCPQCNKGFKQPCHLNQHLRTHTDERPFPCEVCRKAFKQACQLKQHMRLHTGEKPYHCSECNRAFKQASQLNQHIRLHTGEKPYKCNHCDKTFTQASQLRSHKKTHDPKPERKATSKRPKAIPRGHIVLPFPAKASPPSLSGPLKPPSYLNPNMKLDPNLSFKTSVTYNAGGAPLQVCHVRELPVTTIPADFHMQ